MLIFIGKNNPNRVGFAPAYRHGRQYSSLFIEDHMNQDNYMNYSHSLADLNMKSSISQRFASHFQAVPFFGFHKPYRYNENNDPIENFRGPSPA